MIGDGEVTENSVDIEKKWKDARYRDDRSIGLRYISATWLVVDDSIKGISGFI